MTVFR